MVSPFRSVQTEGSFLQFVLACGTARQEGFLLMCLSLTKGCYAVASGLFLRAQCPGRRHYPAVLPVHVLINLRSVSSRQTFSAAATCCCLESSVSERKASSSKGDRRLPPFLSLSLILFIPMGVHFTSDINSTVADLH